MTALAVDDFTAFFEAIHEQEPFPWQRRLLEQVASEGQWPSVLDLPTGSGKTAAIDIAVFHLALEAQHGEKRQAPVRIAFVVDRRLVVDDAYARARKIEQALLQAEPGSVTGRVAARLKGLSGSGPPLCARRLRGGIPREDDWARTSSQPTVLCSTVDQVGSRLLFRGYGVSDRMKPIHAGLIGSDCLILLDEAHLAEPFRQTLGWVRLYRSERWRDPEIGHQAPWGVSLLTATPGETPDAPFTLRAEDYETEVLAHRLDASKPVRLTEPVRARTNPGSTEGDEASTEEKALLDRISTEVGNAIAALSERGIDKPAIGVVANRVGRARAVFERLRREVCETVGEPILMIGPTRPADRNDIAEALEPLRTRTWRRGEARALSEPVVLVATQCIEAGVDIDLDALITEMAPIDALRQRFGRVNRAGRELEPYGAIVTKKSFLGARYEDPVYGKAIKPAWDYLSRAQSKRSKKDVGVVDFGLNRLRDHMQDNPVPGEALSPKDDAPVLLPAHLNLLSHTSPIPAADPEVGLYLHGVRRQPDAVAVVWRADVDPDPPARQHVCRLLMLAPPRSAESIELPLWAVRRWLTKAPRPLADLADIPAAEPEENTGRRLDSERRVFRWKGDDERSEWIAAGELRPGDTIVVPASYGGLDEFGWNPDRPGPADDEQAPPVHDVANKAATPYRGRRFVVRVAPGLLGESVGVEALADALAAAPTRHWKDLRDTVLDLTLPPETKEALLTLDQAQGGPSAVRAHTDLYGDDEQGRPRGVVFVAPFGLDEGDSEVGGNGVATEDDITGSAPGYLLTVEQHSTDVEEKAGELARLAGLPEDRVADLRLAGYLHDSGKVDPRFQAWMHHGDPLGPDPDEPLQILAKSARSLPQSARQTSGLPDRWRHEALSVRVAINAPRFAEARDPELVLWLIGSHHGHGRPLFPHADPKDAEARELPPIAGLPRKLMPGRGPQSLAFDWRGSDWPQLYERLKARYGVWELARMEAILRLADHRASEEAGQRQLAEGVSE